MSGIGHAAETVKRDVAKVNESTHWSGGARGRPWLARDRYIIDADVWTQAEAKAEGNAVGNVVQLEAWRGGQRRAPEARSWLRCSLEASLVDWHVEHLLEVDALLEVDLLRDDVLKLDACRLALGKGVEQLGDVARNGGFAGAGIERQCALLCQRDERAFDVFEAETEGRCRVEVGCWWHKTGAILTVGMTQLRDNRCRDNGVSNGVERGGDKQGRARNNRCKVRGGRDFHRVGETRRPKPPSADGRRRADSRRWWRQRRRDQCASGRTACQ